MTPEETANLTNLIMVKRNQLQLSVNEVARRADISPTMMWRIEQGLIANTRMDRLLAITDALGITRTDLFTTIGWLPAADLPTLSTYLRVKYYHLPDAVIRHIARDVTKIVHAYNNRTDTDESCPECTDRQPDHPADHGGQS
ncbi:hypothetical protein CG716_17465 [Mycolicibacterium sphagni]|uniref:HTH cro/C1-type domain-containing protein n=1 Tax=Mycolicibacterium sphagni TaxID=1786 RepID=A0A255DFD4_9MYCO|nr:hypothetical protein CG716_17465 [Mycolicibacterium sphagni]